MTRREEREARQEARQKLFELIADGKTPKQAQAEVNKWGKAKYGADWAMIIAFLKPIITALIAKWLKV